MPYEIIVSDENSKGIIINQIYLTFTAPSITIEELIKTRVEQELQDFGANNVQNIEDVRRRQTSSRQSRHIALGSFRENGFFIKVNGQVIHQLKQEISILPNTEIRFVQLQ